MYQVTEVGERMAVACPGEDVGVQTASLKLNLADAFPDDDVKCMGM